MKITKVDVFGFILILLIMCGLFYLVLYMSDKDTKMKECLKPSAEEYCNNKGMVLKNHNELVFFCSEDLRSQSERYNYLKEEKEHCKNNDAKGRQNE